MGADAHPVSGLAQGKKPRCAWCRNGEAVTQLLERLDTALGKAMADDSVIDQILPEISTSSNLDSLAY